MSTKVFIQGKYKFYFFSREGDRMHVHVISSEGEAKYWVEPTVSLANYTRFSNRELNKIQKIIEEHKYEVIKKWKVYFKTGNN